jgi:hypothetical protein
MVFKLFLFCPLCCFAQFGVRQRFAGGKKLLDGKRLSVI